MKWKLNAITVNHWLNLILREWDFYLDHLLKISNSDKFLNEENYVYFLRKSKKATENYFEISNLLDAIILEIEYLCY